MSNGGDSKYFLNISASTPVFNLLGGQYGVDAVATFGGGSVKLQRLAPDGTTWLSLASGTDFSAAGYSALYLPPGGYRFTIATATAVYAEVVAIPRI